MTPELRRKFVSEAAIALSLALGSHFLLVEPQHEQLAQLRRDCSAISATIPDAAAEAEALPIARAVLQECRLIASDIDAAGRLARSESAMFTKLMDLARIHRVRIERMEPRTPLMPAAPPSPSASSSAFAPGAPTDSSAAPTTPPLTPAVSSSASDIGIGYSISLEASYADLIGFLAALQTELGYTLIRSMRLQPSASASTDSADRVVATIETAHFSVNPSPVHIPPPPVGAAGYAGVGAP